MTEIIAEHDIGDTVVVNIIGQILGKVAAIYHMYLLKRGKQVARNGIAEAVLQYQQPTWNPGICLNLRHLRIAPMKVQ